MSISGYEVENCPNCRAIYRLNNWGMCQNCKNDMESDLTKCTEAIRKNRKITLEELTAQTGVSNQKISKYIRDTKIFVGDVPNLFYSCELCGSGIRKGNLCLNCRTKLNTDIEKMVVLEAKEKEKLRKEHHAGFKISDRINKN